jgi:hypothetical protein
MTDHPADIKLEIPKENAVFWMDERGRWCNEHGPFEHPKIIEYFNKAIHKDENGYYVGQSRDGLYEKVYFRHAETPVFIVEVLVKEPLILVMNTGKQIELDPGQLFVRNDQLYLHMGDEIAKFGERALLRISEWIEYGARGIFYIRNGKRLKILED